MDFKNVPVIYSYTRAQAIADGVLVNLSDTKEWAECGFKYPVACTRAVWEKYIEWTDADSERQVHQDQSGRLWDVLFMLRYAISQNRTGGDQVLFEFYVVPRGGKGHRPRRTILKALCGPGDYAEPVITILLPNED